MRNCLTIKALRALRATLDPEATWQAMRTPQVVALAGAEYKMVRHERVGRRWRRSRGRQQHDSIVTRPAQ